MYIYIYVILHKFDITCGSETYLDSTIPNDDDKLQISGYTLIRSDHPSNTKRNGVCKYYKSSSPLSVRNIVYLHECLSFELQIGDEKRQNKTKVKTSFESNTIETVTSQLGLYQIINEPTHMLPNYSSCTDLIFTLQPNLII